MPKFGTVSFQCRCKIKIDMFISGLPNTFGGYDETPEMTAEQLKVQNVLKS